MPFVLLFTGMGHRKKKCTSRKCLDFVLVGHRWTSIQVSQFKRGKALLELTLWKDSLQIQLAPRRESCGGTKLLSSVGEESRATMLQRK